MSHNAARGIPLRRIKALWRYQEIKRPFDVLCLISIEWSARIIFFDGPLPGSPCIGPDEIYMVTINLCFESFRQLREKNRNQINGVME